MQAMQQALRLQCIDNVERCDGTAMLLNVHTTITTGEPQSDLLKTGGMYILELYKCSVLSPASHSTSVRFHRIQEKDALSLTCNEQPNVIYTNCSSLPF